jgi:hypothetical protein
VGVMSDDILNTNSLSLLCLILSLEFTKFNKRTILFSLKSRTESLLVEGCSLKRVWGSEMSVN